MRDFKKVNKIIKISSKSNAAIKQSIISSKFFQNKSKGIDLSKVNIESHFAYLSKALDDFNESLKCSEKKCHSRLNGFLFDFEIKNNSIIKFISFCPCLKSKKGSWTSLDNKSLTGLDKKYHNLFLNNIESQDKVIQKILIYFSKVLKAKGVVKKGLLITSQSVIKNKLVAGFANDFYGINPNICYINAKNNFEEFSLIDNFDYLSLIKYNYRISKLLIIDNLGEEKIKSYARDSILYPILKHRLKNGLLTIITTRHTKKKLFDIYKKNNNDEISKLFLDVICKQTILVSI